MLHNQVCLQSVPTEMTSNAEVDAFEVDAFQDYMQEQISLEFADDCVHAPPLFTPPFTNTTVTSIQPPLLMVSTNTRTTRKRKQYSSHATSNKSTRNNPDLQTSSWSKTIDPLIYSSIIPKWSQLFVPIKTCIHALHHILSIPNN